MKKYTSFILPGFLIALFLGCASELCAGGKPPVPKNPSRIFRLRQPGKITGIMVPRPVHSYPLVSSNLSRSVLPASTVLSVSRAAEQARVPSMVAAFHADNNDSVIVPINLERKPMRALPDRPTPSGGNKMSSFALRLALAEEGALPPDADVWTRDALQEFYDTYMAFKSGAKVASLFEGNSETERQVWMHNQPDYSPENFVYDKYTTPFNSKIGKLRVLVVNDKREIIEPLFDVAAKDSRIEVTWVQSPSGIISQLKSGDSYDAILCDYVMNGGTADMLGIEVYNEKIPVPVVFYSAAGATPDYLMSHNILGRIDVALTSQEARRVFNYLSNLAVWYRNLEETPSHL